MEIIPMLPDLIEEHQQALEPVDRRAFAEKLAALFEWAELVGVAPQAGDESPAAQQARATWRKRWLTLYHVVLGKLPPDLLETSVRRALERPWAKMPTPGDLLAFVSTDYTERQDRLNRLTTAQILAKRSPEPEFRTVPTEEDREQARAACQRISQMLAEAGKPIVRNGGGKSRLMKRLAAERGDGQDRSADPYREAYKALQISPDA